MSAEPIASGTLEQTPFAHLLVYLDQKVLSGTLALWPDDAQEAGGGAEDRILFLKGRPVAGCLVTPAATLREGLLTLFARMRAPYAFYEGNLLHDNRQSGRIDAYALVAEALRANAGSEAIQPVLARLGGSKLRIQPKVDFNRYDFEPNERALVELLQAEPCELEILVLVSGLSEAIVRRVVYLLAITKAVAPYDAAQSQSLRPAPARAESGPLTAEGVSGPRRSQHPERAETGSPAEGEAPAEPRERPSPRPPRASHPPRASVPPASILRERIDTLDEIPPAPDDLSADLLARWQRVVTKARLIENQNYFEILGLDKEAPGNEIKTRFFQFAKEWHPDRLPRELVALRPHCEIIFGFMNEAHATLQNDEERTRYLQTLREGGGTPATDRLVQRTLDTAMVFERVLVLGRQHRYDDAIDTLRRILEANPREPDYHAHYAWLLMQKYPKDDSLVDRMFEAANAALKLQDKHEKANLYKAQLLRRIGKQKDAFLFFKKVAEINPRNVEAQREIRIATMRQGGTPREKVEKAAGGFFGKLFGKE